MKLSSWTIILSWASEQGKQVIWKVTTCFHEPSLLHVNSFSRQLLPNCIPIRPGRSSRAPIYTEVPQFLCIGSEHTLQVWTNRCGDWIIPKNCNWKRLNWSRSANVTIRTWSWAASKALMDVIVKFGEDKGKRLTFDIRNYQCLIMINLLGFLQERIIEQSMKSVPQNIIKWVPFSCIPTSHVSCSLLREIVCVVGLTGNNEYW